MTYNNSYFLEVLEREKRDQIQQEVEKVWYRRQLPNKESKRLFALDKLTHIYERFSIAIRSPRFSFRYATRNEVYSNYCWKMN